MNRYDPEETEALLLARRRKLLERHRRNVARENELGGNREIDPHDRGSDEAEIGRMERLDAAEQAGLARIDAALARLAAGRYGHCEECGAEIDAGRLAAVPEATFCRDCGQPADDRSEPWEKRPLEERRA